jgi:hypothetical protein
VSALCAQQSERVEAWSIHTSGLQKRRIVRLLARSIKRRTRVPSTYLHTTSSDTPNPDSTNPSGRNDAQLINRTPVQTCKTDQTKQPNNPSIECRIPLPSSQTSQHPLPLPPPPRKYEIHLSPNPFHFSLALSFTLSVVPSRRLRYTHNVVCLFLVLNVQKFASRLRVFSSALVWRRCLDGLGFGSADEEMFGESVLGGAGDELGGG